MATALFWQRKRPSEMTPREWESLCDGCGKCCLHKLEDEDTGEFYFTQVACRLLDPGTCQCRDYANRATQVPDCLQLRPDNVGDLGWLPATCAYRLIDEGKPLPEWHHLRSGSRQTIHAHGESAAGRILSEEVVAEEDLEEHIIHWVY